MATRKKVNRKSSKLPPLFPRRKRERRQVEFLGVVAISGFALLIGGAFFLTSLQQRLLGSPQVAAVVSAVLVDLANGDRAENGLGALTSNPKLVAAAQAKANDMAEKGYFAHVAPDGTNPWHWFKEADYNFSYAGENLAIDFSDSADVNNAWMNSPAHRENLLNPKFTEVGIATAQGTYEGRLTTFVVQEFGTPSTVAQSGVKDTIVPENPTRPALATAESSDERVLGSAAVDEQNIPTTHINIKVATTEPAVAAALSVQAAEHTPVWRMLVGFPHDTLRYAYYLIGMLVLIALAIETGFEIHRRHRRHAIKASILLVTMAGLIIVANLVIFVQPTLAATGTLLGG